MSLQYNTRSQGELCRPSLFDSCSSLTLRVKKDEHVFQWNVRPRWKTKMTNIDIVKRMYEAFGNRDRETILALFDPNIEWIQNEGFPGGGRHVGALAVLDNVFAKFRRDWEVWQAPVSEWLDAGEIVVAIGEYRGTYKATGRSMTAAFAGLYRVNAGRIVQFRQFTDTAKIAEAMGGRNQGSGDRSQ